MRKTNQSAAAPAARAIAGTVSDPTLPKTPIEIDGKVYHLCFDLGALAEAETAINAECRAAGAPRVNLLVALPVQNLENTRIVFAAAVRTFHPEITFPQAMALLTFENIWEVALKIQAAWAAAVGEAEPSPTQPGTAPESLPGSSTTPSPASISK